MQHHSLFSDKAELYAQARPQYPLEVFDYLADLCDERQLAWDCACGNGQAATDLVQRFNAIHASDVSQQQIANAKPHPRIDYAITPSERTNLADHSVDLVCVAQALHWFDYETFWPEVLRVLKHGGVFSALAYKMPSVDSLIDTLIEDLILSVIEPFWAPENQLIDNDYRDIAFPFTQIDSPRFCMTSQLNHAEFFALIHTFSATRRCMDEQGDDFFKQAYDITKQQWGTERARDETLKKIVSFDFVFYAGRNL